MHVWLYEYGHPQDDNSTYSYEDICEIVASSNEFVNKVVGQYANQKEFEEVFLSQEELRKALDERKKWEKV